MRKLLVPGLILGLLIAIYFFPASIFRDFWITGDLGYSDLTDLNWPIKTFLSDSIRQGCLPIWTKDILCGLPLLAEGEGGFFYPLNLILFLLAKPFFAYNLSILFTFLLAGLFTFLFCTSIKLPFFPCLFAAVSFIFSGFFICHLKHPAMIMVASLFPLLLYLAERFIREPRPIFCILAGIILSFQVFAGHPQIMVYTNLSLTIYFVGRLFFLEKEKKKRKTWRVLSLLYFLPIMAVIGAGLSACQLLPTMELLEQSGRKMGGAVHELTRFPFHPAELVRFVLPYFYGDPYLANHKTPWEGLFWENTAYVGIIPLILAALAIAKIKRNKYIFIFAIIALASLLLAFGKYSPLLFLLKLPPLSSYRFPNRFLLIFAFSLSILAAFGMEWVLSKIKQRKLGIIFSIVIISVCFLDLLRFGHHQNPVASAKDWLTLPESVKFLKQDRSIYRIYSVGSIVTRNNLYFTDGWKNAVPYVQHREVLSVNTNLEHKLSSPGIYMTLFPLRPYIFEMRLGGISLNSANYTGEIAPDILRLLSLLNVKYLVSCFSLNLPVAAEIKMDWQLPSVKIYENRDVFSRAYVVGKSFFVQDPNTIIDILASDWFNPRKRVILEEQGPPGSEDIEGSSCVITEYKDDRVKISAKMTKPGYLVLTDSNYPGWKAYVDGKESHIYYANCAFRAVYLEKGEHKIKFIYSPASFKKGVVITLSTIFLIGLTMLAYKKFL